MYYINTNEIPNHFTLIVFWCERRDLLWSHSNGDIFTCEDNMLFSHVKISCFCAKSHLVFHWHLYNKYLYQRVIRYIILQLYTPYWLIILSFSSETEVSSNAELPKPANIINDLVNPGELIKQAQKESVLNNTFSNKAEEAKGMNNCSGTYPTRLQVFHTWSGITWLLF